MMAKKNLTQYRFVCKRDGDAGEWKNTKEEAEVDGEKHVLNSRKKYHKVEIESSDEVELD